MDTLFSILRAAHCRSTHHFFAMDALREVDSDAGRKLANLLLAHYSNYLQGAKDPDNIFKDFENHVLHVQDGYWGGATKACRKWLDTTFRHLRASQWKDAAYAIGVLSHYFTDPFMPLHTAQSTREAIVHRPLEWSVCCAYPTLYTQAYERQDTPSFRLMDVEAWIEDAVLRGATLVNPDYVPLMDNYSLIHSQKRPADALGPKARDIVSKIFVYVLTAWGKALDRIALESAIDIPDFPLQYAAVLASIQVPNAKLLAKMESVEQRKAAERILDEFSRTGKVVRQLPQEQITVRRVRETRPDWRPPEGLVKQAIVLFPESLESPSATSRSPSQPRTPNAPDQPTVTESQSIPVRFSSPPPTPLAIHNPAADAESSVMDLDEPQNDDRDSQHELPRKDHEDEPDRDPDRDEEENERISEKDVPEAPPSRKSKTNKKPLRIASTNPRKQAPQPSKPPSHSEEDSAEDNPDEKATTETNSESSRAGGRVSKPKLQLEDPVVEAPAIGPKTAERLHQVGCHTVQDLLNADPQDLAKRLKAKWITESLVADWQAQATLATQIAGLPAIGAGLLVLAGFRDRQALAESSLEDLFERVTEAAQTRVGARLLRDKPPPPRRIVEGWWTNCQVS